jgi:hypothetical protein
MVCRGDERLHSLCALLQTLRGGSFFRLAAIACQTSPEVTGKPAPRTEQDAVVPLSWLMSLAHGSPDPFVRASVRPRLRECQHRKVELKSAGCRFMCARPRRLGHDSGDPMCTPLARHPLRVPAGLPLSTVIGTVATVRTSLKEGDGEVCRIGVRRLAGGVEELRFDNESRAALQASDC